MAGLRPLLEVDLQPAAFLALHYERARGMNFTTGVVGGFTTSNFSLDFAVLWERGQVCVALSYAIASVVLSIGALFIGLSLMRALLVGGPS